MKTFAYSPALPQRTSLRFFGTLGNFLSRLVNPEGRAEPASTSPGAAELIAGIEAQPALRMWVMALDGKTARVQRALLTRASLVLREQNAHESSSAILDSLTDGILLTRVLAGLRESVSAQAGGC